MTVFLRAVTGADKASVLLAAAAGDPGTRFVVEPNTFRLVPGSPFAYWVSDATRRLFQQLPPFEGDGRRARHGASTKDDFRFLRMSGESSPRSVGRSWDLFVKGGAFSPYYADVALLVKWRPDARELEAAILVKYPYLGESADWVLHRENPYFTAGLTWPRRPHSKGYFTCVPSGCVFADNGPMAFVDEAARLTWLALLNGSAFHFLVQLLMARGHAGSGQTLTYEIGMVAVTPVPDLSPADEAILASLARQAWSLKRSLDTRTETSHAFVLPALLQVRGESLAARSATSSEHVREVEAELAAIQAEIDERCFELYGINDEDRRSITEGFVGSETSEQEEEGEGDADLEEEAESEAVADAATLAAELVSWAVGVAFGRFDVRLAMGARALPAEPEPFDPLPVCSPAMLTGDDGLPLASPPAGYPISFPEDGILVDDPGHPRDLTTAVRAVFETVFGPRADAVWQEAAALLNPRDHDMRKWLASGFFDHHLKRHSKSRRKAPILWQLGVPTARYTIWLYAHRLTRDSLFALARDIVAPRLALEERRRTSLVQDAGPNPTAKQRADISAQDAIVEELRAFAHEVRRVAPLWNPDLDDGVVLVMAPLWRLVPGHRAWQKELKSRWGELVSGKYDWAHLAMHLWPERAVPKCATDRSLAIAHGLEDAFWIEGAEAKWLPRSKPSRSIEDLVAERTSPAVKAALADLLAAAASGGSGVRPGRTRGVKV